VRVLYNTYWVRFNHKLFTLADALKNSLTLFNAAKEAEVRKIVHISITNPSEDSHLEYFRGKAELEKALIDTGLLYSIIRPTVLFGKEDIFINNIAWALRKLPIFAVFGDGHYRLQPIHVYDLAELAVKHGEKEENSIINAIGPETFTYRELVQTIGKIIGRKKPIISVHPTLVYIAGRIISLVVNDVLVTREEIEGLMSNLLCVNSPPTGKTRLTDWIKEHAKSLGRQYTSELARRIDRETEYKSN
jgi:NADH dehydrogenase